MIAKRESFLKYGLPSPMIELALSKKLTVTSIKATSIEVLTSKYGLTTDEASFIKKHLARKPIDNKIVDSLLVNNNFTCCCCLGAKGNSFIIHHIEEYE